MPKQKSSASSAQSAQSKKADRTAQGSGSTDAIALLKTDHRTVLEAFKKYESLRSREEKQELIQTICNDLIVHTKIEEEIFYPACRERGGPKEALDEAQVEHDGAKVLIGELLSEPIDSEFYDAKVRVLAEYIRHHVGEEEKSGDGIFAKAQAGGVDLKTLGQRLQSRKQELTAQGTLRTRIGREDFRALELEFASTATSEERQSMARYDQDRQGENFRGRYRGGRDRDEYGRFRGEEDRYYGQGSGRDDYEDDRRYSRGQFGDSERDRDEFGRFTGDQDDRFGYGEGRGYNRNEDQQRSAWRDEGSRGYGGWEGQRRGGERGFERGSENWNDDRGSSRYRGRDYEEDDQNYASNRGGGEGRGWYGDSEGHSRAAERGWEERGYGSRSRGREDYDRQGQRGNQNRGRDEEHGGWFGDARGHSEAARRGWQNR